MHDFFSPGRSDVMSHQAMITTSHPLATSVGLKCLYDGGNAVDAAIAAAMCVINRAETNCASGLTDECLTLAATYLAAHFAAVTENTLSVSSETDPCCDAKVTYGFKFGKGVEGTPFGQMANTITGGCLVEMDKKPMRMYAIGASC